MDLFHVSGLLRRVVGSSDRLIERGLLFLGKSISVEACNHLINVIITQTGENGRSFGMRG